MARSLPRRPSFSSLQKQAKKLLRLFRQNDAEAASRVRQHHPRPDAFSALRDAQVVIAREYGSRNWSALRQDVDDALIKIMNRSALGFVECACLAYDGKDDHRKVRKATHILEQMPGLASHSIYSAAAAADVVQVRRLLKERPGAAVEPGGPRGWVPLLYLTYSRVPERLPERDAVEVTRLLLGAGADPDSAVILEGPCRFTAITGAIGEGENGLLRQPPHTRARELVELLLDRGANPNDFQGLYNSQFSPGNEWLELLLERGLTTEDRADWTDSGMRTLDYVLGQAVTAGQETRVALLLRHGANAQGVNTYNTRPHLDNALLEGHLSIAALLEQHGAQPAELASHVDRFRAACMGGQTETARRLLAQRPQLIHTEGLFVDCATNGSIVSLQLLLDLGADINQRRTNGKVALHQAAWEGKQELIRFLLARGADPDIRDGGHTATPASWANHSGKIEARDQLLDHTRDVFDLATWGRVDALAEVLAADPAQARRRRSEGETPLHRLETGGERGARVIDLLSDHGADILARNKDGYTPLDCAPNQGEGIRELLIERGADGGEHPPPSAQTAD